MKFSFLFLMLMCLFYLGANGQSLLSDVSVTQNIYEINYPANLSGATPPPGMMLTFKANATFANSGASTLQLNPYSAIPILKNSNQSLIANDIKASAFVTVIFDGTNWQMLSVTSNPVGNVSSGGGTGYVPRFASGIALLNSPIQTDGTWTSIGIAPQTNYVFRIDQTTSVYPAIYGQNSFTDGTAIWGYSNNASTNARGVKGQATGIGTAMEASNTDPTGYAFKADGRSIFTSFVGIGINAPAVKLDVRGTNATATTAIRDNILQVAATDGTNPLALRLGVKTDAVIANRYGYIEALDAGAQNLILQPQNGNVGIGTTGISANARLAVKDGHIQSQQTTAPIAAPQAGAGTAATCILNNATDVAGSFTLTGGTGSWAIGPQCRITFNKSYAVPPIIIINPGNLLAAQLHVSKQTLAASNTNYFEITWNTAESVASRVFIYNYLIIETQ